MIIRHPCTCALSTRCQCQFSSFRLTVQLLVRGVHILFPSPLLPCMENQDTRHRIRIPYHTHSTVVCCNWVTNDVPDGQTDIHHIGSCLYQRSADASSLILPQFSDVWDTGSSPDHTVLQTTFASFYSSPTFLPEDQ